MMINYSPVTQFIQQVKSAELGQQKEIKMSIQQARLLHITLSEMMNKINMDWETVFNELKNHTASEIVSISMDGGDFT